MTGVRTCHGASSHQIRANSSEAMIASGDSPRKLSAFSSGALYYGTRRCLQQVLERRKLPSLK